MQKLYDWSILIITILALLPASLYAQERNASNSSTNDHSQIGRETHVTPTQALNVGYTFMRTGNNTRGNSVSKQTMQLVYTGRAVDSLTPATTDCYYVFSLQPKGFVIVAADDRVEPILGYSYDNNFVVENMPDHVRGWLGNYEKQIEAVVKQDIAPEAETTTKWSRLKAGQSMSTRSGESVGPLLTTQWDQWYPYNAQCPNGCPTGCTATATAQIMNYWQWPAKGVGYHSYVSDVFGPQAVYFNENNYIWDSMMVDYPNHISKLMYHVGVSMDMDYEYDGSGAYLSSAQDGLQRYFDYSDSSIYVHRADFSDAVWNEMLIYYLDANMPILYEGYGSGGHAWVIDGYDMNGFYHMNYGWSGSNDGYYSLNSLNPGWFVFNDGQGAVLGIHPSHSPLTADFEMVKGDSVLKYNFYDFSKGSPNQHLWFFGDGSSSTLTNPVHIFDTTGVFQITLIVSNATSSDTILREVEIIRPQFWPKEMGLGELKPYFSPLVFDYDMDGKLDFYASGCFYQQLYHNEESFFSYTLLTTGESLPSSEQGRPVVVDFEHENRPSVLAGEKNGYYWYNNSGNLELRTTKLNEWFRGVPVLGDYNGDGEDDLILNGILYKNLGNYNFIQVSDNIYDTGLMYDYDGDGDLDFVGAITYRNDGNDVFTETEPFDGISIYDKIYRLTGDIADMNLDGHPDLVACPRVWYNNINGSVTNVIQVELEDPDWWYGNSSLADVNSDGASDLICNHSFYIEFYENQIDSLVLNNKVDYPLDFGQDGGEYYNYRIPSDGSFIDQDNNNIPDVVIMTPWGHSTFWKNTCSITNNPPSIPQNLWADTLGNSVVLHWDTVSDDHSRYGSITYNIMVGTALDSFDIKSPLSNIATGKRYAYNRGNAGHAPLWKLNNLPNGTYYWRVQAIDNSLAASPFSESGTFVINGNNLPPLMSNLTITSYCNRRNYLSGEALKERFTDRENDTLQGFQIIKAPTNGVLHMGDSVVQINQYVSYSDIDSIWFITNMFEDDSLWVKVFDGHGYSKDSSLIRFNVKLFEKTFEVTGVSGDVAWGDYDKDGKADFACTSGIYHNTGNGFEKLADSIPPAERVLWADINNDGWLDCLFDGYVLTNTGTGHFTFDSTLVDWSETGVAVGDVNNDNKVDYVLSGSPDHFAEMASRLFYNIGGSLSNDSVNSNLQGYRGGDIAVVDFDNDGRQDVLMNGIDDYGNHRSTTLFRNILIGSLSSTSDSLYGVNKGSLCYGDYDHDGDIDLLMCGTQGTWDNFITIIYDNNGAGMLDEHVFPRGENPFQPVALGQAKWFDFDNDGFLDVVLSGMNAGTHLYRNIGGLNFKEVLNTTLPYLTNSSLAIIDFDGDDYGDILLSGYDNEGTPTIAVYNNCIGSGNSMSHESILAPTNLSANIKAYDVTLSWNAITESYNTYNLYVRDSNGFVVSPMADTATGFRKVVEKGNAGNLNFFKLKDLPAGTYYWSVQSVNNALQGGIFADEKTFTIVPHEADTIVIYDTACHHYSSGLHTYKRSGVFYERYERESDVDSVVELHLTIHKDCTPIVYVAQHPVSYQDGCSWKSAFSDLQRGIDLALAVHGNLWVAQGDYHGDEMSEFAFTFNCDLHMYGGFEGSEPEGYDLSLRNFKLHPTILNGNSNQSVIQQEWYQAEYALIDGFTIRDGLEYNVYGPGLRINNCILMGTPSSSAVGRFGYNNEIANSVILSHTSLNYVNVSNSVIVGPDISVTRNWSSYKNCIFWNYSGTIPDDVTYSAIQGRIVSGDGNITLAYNNDGTSPDSNYVRFVNPENGDFRLSYGSACINAGTPDISELGLPSVDLQGLPRVMDGRIDMGAFEYYPVPVVETYDTTCEGNSVVFFDSICSAMGQYLHHTNVEEVASDTLYVFHLQVYPTYSTDSIIQLSGNGYVRDGQSYIQSGVYSFNYTSVHGCDSIIRITLCDSLISVCDNQLPFIYNDTTFGAETVSGLYSVTSNGQSLFMYLQVNPTHTVFDTITVCENQWVYVGDVCFHDSLPGDYQVMLQSSYGCDSLVNLHYTVNPSYWFDLYDTIPRGTEYSDNGFYISAEETQNVRQMDSYNWNWTSTGCDSTSVLHLTLTGTPIRCVTQNGIGDGSSWENAMGGLQAAMDSAALVQGDVWVAQGTYYGDGVSENAFVIPDGVHVYGGFAGNEPADYDLSLRNFATHPTVLDGQHMQRTVYHDWTWNLSPVLDGFTIQNGHSNFGGNIYGGSPKLQVTNCTIQNGVSDGDAGGLYNASARNSVIINNISSYWGSAMQNCDAYNCLITGNDATEYGYTTQWSTLTNCIVWDNVGYPEYGSTITYSAVEGQEVWGEGNITLANNNDGSSPDSNYVRFVNPENGDFRLSYGSACINAGTPDISELGVPIVDLQGLPRVLDGRIDMGAYEYYPVPIVETYDTACEGNGFAFFDSICTATGNYVHHTNVVDVTLDTLYVLHLTVSQATFGDTTAVACGSYTWNSTTYAQSGDYTQTFSAANGCDSVVTLHLTITNTDHTDFTDVACDSYTWNGETYTESGTYSQTFTNSVGCDSIVTLYLTVNYSTTGIDEQTACESYTWIDGVTYTESTNTPTFTLTNAAGCDSIVTLNLTINSAYHEDLHVSACEEYVWNGETYSASGDYNQTFTATNGCDSIVTLHLTINNPVHTAVTEVACESFTWNGTDYTVSGDYTYSHGDANGCTQVDTLHLTIYNPVHTANTETACESFTWNGTDYTVSGDYTYNHADENGCTQVDTLHLTIHFAQSAEFAVTTSDPCYTWNDIDYCTSGDYTQTLQTVHGCDSVVTLHLTITVGVDDYDGFDFKVYPNPTSNIVNVECIMKNEEWGGMELHLCDAYGRLLGVVETHGRASLQTVKIDLSRYAKGVYFVKAVADGETVAVRKVVKQ